MKVTVFGANGMVGGAICHELEARGHQVNPIARSGSSAAVDFCAPDLLRQMQAVIKDADIVVNAVGILHQQRTQTFQRVHIDAVEALCNACEIERVARIVHISAIGVGRGLGGAYLASKQRAEEILAEHSVDYVVVRPSLVIDPSSPSTRFLAQMSRMPIVMLPGLTGGNDQSLAPLSLADLASCVANMAAHPKAMRRTIDIAGPTDMTLRELLLKLRDQIDTPKASALASPLFMRLPWWVMRLGARLAQAIPFDNPKVASVDNLRLLQAGTRSTMSETSRWLGRDPTSPTKAASTAPSTAAGAHEAPRNSLTTPEGIHHVA